MPQLYPKEYDELKTMLTDLAAVVDQLKGNSQNFVRDQIDRHNKYGERMFVSPKQLDWLKNLHEEYVGTVQHVTPKEEREVGEEEGRGSLQDDLSDEVPF